ncbi:MAG: P-loop NTPase, partial [Ilumatobacteraceae bacterium]
TTPALAAQRVAQRAADMARRSFLPVVGVIENMSGFVCEHGEHHEVFGSGGGQALADAVGAPLLGSIPIEAALADGGDIGQPVILSSDGPAATALRAIVNRLRDEVVPMVPSTDGIDMAGCSARLLAAVETALSEADAQSAD